MSRVRFSLNISAETYRHYYSGHAQFVQVRSIDGRRVRFPASSLRPYLSHKGVHGEFELEFDENNKLVALRRLNL
ncbi:MAG: DUF2835 domain-containing protein [Gammaproteobacteria bacterium]|nr:DUF2835 domain-containing protein [Gammaproteobacteria bacterium]